MQRFRILLVIGLALALVFSSAMMSATHADETDPNGQQNDDGNDDSEHPWDEGEGSSSNPDTEEDGDEEDAAMQPELPAPGAGSFTAAILFGDWVWDIYVTTLKSRMHEAKSARQTRAAPRKVAKTRMVR